MGTPITTVDVEDTRGNQWTLYLSADWKTHNGFTEYWCKVLRRPDGVLTDYPALPLPVFTEWWP